MIDDRSWRCYSDCATGGDVADLVIALKLANTSAEAAAFLENRVEGSGHPRIAAPAAPKQKFGAADARISHGINKRRVYVLSCASIAPVETTYLLNPYLPYGEATWFEGATKTGKTTVALDIVARVTTGSPWVDGSPIIKGRAAILTCEDDIARAIVPRLIAAGADLEAVDVIKVADAEGGELTPSFFEDLPGIEEQLQRLSVAILVVDGTFGVLGAKDGNAYVEAYATMGPVIAMVRRLNISAVLVRHVRKTGAPALSAGLGSVGYASLARSTVSFAVDPEDSSVRFMAHAGTNGAISGVTWQYRIINGLPVPGFSGPVGAVDWLGAVSETADEIMSGRAITPDRCLIEIAEDWLRDVLTAEPKATSSLREAASALGISVRTLQRAAKNIGVTMRNGSPGKPGTWAYPLDHAPLAPSNSHGASGVRESERERREAGPSTSHLGIPSQASLAFTVTEKRTGL